MTRNDLYNILHECDGDNIAALTKIWGQPFDGETEKINTTKSVSSTSPVAKESSVTLIKPLADGITYTRSYQVFLPTPPKP